MHNWRRATYVSTALLSLLILAILFPISFRSATPVEGIAKDPNPSTLSFTASSSSASASLSVTNTAGSSASSSSNASFTLYTNNATGYTLRLKTTGGDTLVDSTNSNTSTNHIDPIGTDGITLDQFSNNTWGLLPSKYNGTNNTTNYYKPTTTGFKMDETQAPNTSNNANSYTVGLGIKADYTRPAGTYTNTTIVAEYIANPVSYAIYYNANTTATVTDMPSTNPQSGTVQDPTVAQTVTLASAPTRNGYTFSGWCLGTGTSSNITTTNGVDTCNSTKYDAGQQFGINAVDGTSSTNYNDTYYLYAMWTGNEYTATIYYKGASNVTSSTATKCRISSLAGTSCDATIDSTVRSSTGTYSNAWAGIATAVNSMTPINSGNNITLSSSSTYYAFYRTNVTNYYYTGSAYSNRTLYRNQTLSSTSAMGTTYLSTTSTGLSNYSTAGGPNSSTWYGLSTALSNTTRTYSSVAAAATSTSTTLNSIYRFTQNFSSTGSTGVSSIGSTAEYCYVSSTAASAGGTSCSVTTPTISVNTGYSSLGWGTQGHTSAGTAASTSITVSTSGGTLYANAKLNTYNVKVNFAGSGVSSVTFTASGHTTRTVSTSGNTATLDYGTAYTMTMAFTSGYEFVSWALNNVNYGTLGSTSTNPTTFTPNVNSTSAVITATGQKQVITFAQVYASAGASQDGGYYVMQDLTSDICTSVSDEQTTTLKDRRDGSTYTVAKLLDGNCWMTQNLALDLTALTQAQLYGTGTNAGKLTNASNTTLGYLKNGGGTTSDQYPTAKLNNVAWTSSSQNYYSIPMMVSSGTCKDAYCVNNPSSGNWSFDATLPATINGETSRIQGKIGIYYNYCAASAGSYCYGNGTSYLTSSGNASEDICPYGWHLPADNTAQGSFYYLYNTGYSANRNNFVDALSTPLSGSFRSGKASSQGQGGSFWSSTRNNNSNMYILLVYSDSVHPSNTSYRSTATSVRCVRTS